MAYNFGRNWATPVRTKRAPNVETPRAAFAFTSPPLGVGLVPPRKQGSCDSLNSAASRDAENR